MSTRLDTLGPNSVLATAASRSTEPGLASEGWQREMERAQAQEWFLGALTYRQHDIATHAAGTVRPDAIAAASPSVPAAGSDTVSLAARHIVMQALRFGADPGSRLAPGTGALAGYEAMGQGMGLQADSTKTGSPGVRVAGKVVDSDPAATLPEPATDPLPMRLHIEIGEAGGRLWVGTTASSVEQIEQAVAEVRRRLSERGIPLTGVTCNGKPWNQNLAMREYATTQTQYSLEENNHGIDR